MQTVSESASLGWNNTQVAVRKKCWVRMAPRSEEESPVFSERPSNLEQGNMQTRSGVE